MPATMHAMEMPLITPGDKTHSSSEILSTHVHIHSGRKTPLFVTEDQDIIFHVQLIDLFNSIRGHCPWTSCHLSLCLEVLLSSFI